MVVDLAGVVRALDHTRAELPGVTIIVQTPAGTEVHRVFSDANGSYTFAGLWPAEYVVRAELSGGISTATAVCLSSRKRLDIDLRFDRGECQCVSAANPDGSPYRPKYRAPRLSGVVRDEGGHAIRRAVVAVLIGNQLKGTVQTSWRGRFNIETGSSERVTLRVRAPSYYDEEIELYGNETGVRVVLHGQCQ